MTTCPQSNNNLSIRIATRKSPLALWQANFVKTQLLALHAGITVELLPLSTQGDRHLGTSLATVGGKGLFVKELEVALLDGRADIAVHSMKDMPMELPIGLQLPVICKREDPHDALVSNTYACLDDLPQGSRIGTSSLRRQCQLRHYRPDWQLIDLRGNVNTRLNKLDDNHFDAIILACAGLKRLGFDRRIRESITVEHSLPAGGQGAIGIEMRATDARIASLLAPLHHSPTADAVCAERVMNGLLQGGCQAPIASYAIPDSDDNGQLWLRGLVGSVDGRQVIRAQARAPRARAHHLGMQVAEDLLNQGANVLLQELRH